MFSTMGCGVVAQWLAHARNRNPNDFRFPVPARQQVPSDSGTGHGFLPLPLHQPALIRKSKQWSNNHHGRHGMEKGGI